MEKLTKILGIGTLLVAGCTGNQEKISREEIYTFQFRGKPAAVVKEKKGRVIFYYIDLDGNGEVRGTITGDDGKLITVEDYSSYSRGFYYSIKDNPQPNSYPSAPEVSENADLTKLLNNKVN